MEEFVKKIQVGEKFKVKFVSMTHDGKGVCKINGMLKNDSLAENFPIFVNNAISSEEGIIEITSLKKTLGNGKIIKSPSTLNPLYFLSPQEQNRTKIAIKANTTVSFFFIKISFWLE